MRGAARFRRRRGPDCPVRECDAVAARDAPAHDRPAIRSRPRTPHARTFASVSTGNSPIRQSMNSLRTIDRRREASAEPASRADVLQRPASGKLNWQAEPPARERIPGATSPADGLRATVESEPASARRASDRRQRASACRRPVCGQGRTARRIAHRHDVDRPCINFA